MKSLLIALSLTFLATVLLWGCKTATSTVKSLAEYNGRSIAYGNQGGVSGGGTATVLLENGQVFSTSNLPKTEKYVGKTASDGAKSLMDEALALVSSHTELNGTGNMTYYIIYKDGTNEKKISWPAEASPPDDVRTLIKKLKVFTQSKTK